MSGKEKVVRVWRDRSLTLMLLLAGGCFSSVDFRVSADGGQKLVNKPKVDAGVDADPPKDESDASDAASSDDAHSTGISVSGDLGFGAVNCGASAGAKSVVVSNGTASPVSFTAELGRAASSPYSLSFSPTTETIAPQGTATITVKPAPIPKASATPGTYADTLTITTNAVGDSPHVVQLTEAAQGAILSFDTQTIPFGDVPVATSQSSTFRVVNTGTAAGSIRLSMGASSSATFTVTPTGSRVVSSGVDLTANATFSPTAAGGDTGSILIDADPSTVLCAPLPDPLVVTGMGENGGLTVSTSALSFGLTSCGTTAASQTFMLTNSGNSSLTWSLQVSNTSPSRYSVGPMTQGALAAGASVTLTVTPGAIPAPSSIQKNFYADTITINTDVVGDAPHVIALSQTAKGSILAFGSSSLGFGDVPVSTTGTEPLQVVNTGNSPATVTLTSSSPAFGAAPVGASGVVGAGDTVNFTGSFSPGNSTASQAATLTMSTGTAAVLCAPLPTPLPLSGTGTNGVVAFSPSALSFGNQTAAALTACGTQAAAQQVVFSNAGLLPYTISASLGGGKSSPYTFAISPMSGVVAASGGTATILVTPSGIPATSAVPGAYNDTLTVTTGVANDSSHTIPLTQSAYGAILTAPPATIAFPATPLGGQSSSQIGITNSGNASAVLSWTGISNSAFTFDENVALAPGGVTTNSSAYFAPTAATAYTATASMAVATSTILCQPLASPNIALSATGTNTTGVGVTPNPVDFNTVSCGSAGGTRTVTIKNNGAASITWKAALTTGTNFSIAPASGSLGPGATVNVTVTSMAIPVSTSTTTASNAFGDTLTVTTSAANDTPHAVPVLETASGAVLAWSTTMLNLPTLQRGQPVAFSVNNTGNVQATIDVLLNNPPNGATLSLNSPAAGATANGTPFQSSVTEGTMSLTSTNATLTLTPAAGTVLCQPGPGPLPITAN